ncbi:hypothetical protein [Aliiruegeria lutimaris]|uniref:hypothetical protein n=1 Tax=Aliiruegeria lutimaris TaxID=571298 RepID=UPI001BAEBEB6|nr:hypothetical protein [Aliiruegeria lutimaris]
MWKGLILGAGKIYAAQGSIAQFEGEWPPMAIDGGKADFPAKRFAPDTEAVPKNIRKANTRGMIRRWAKIGSRAGQAKPGPFAAEKLYGLFKGKYPAVFRQPFGLYLFFCDQTWGGGAGSQGNQGDLKGGLAAQRRSDIAGARRPEPVTRLFGQGAIRRASAQIKDQLRFDRRGRKRSRDCRFAMTQRIEKTPLDGLYKGGPTFGA